MTDIEGPDLEPTWPKCPNCGLCGSVMNDFVSQRFDVGKRVQFKMRLGQCHLCSDVYHREREFLVFAAEVLYPTEYTPPVPSEERVCQQDFFGLFSCGTPDSSSAQSYRDCFHSVEIGPPDSKLTYLSDFSRSSLDLVTRARVLASIRQLPPSYRTVALLYLMGIRSWTRLAEELDCGLLLVSAYFFQARRALQDLVFARPQDRQ